jgi:hypothetical protein
MSDTFTPYEREVLPERPDTDLGWTEPESPASLEYPPKYPFNNITQTTSGHMFEMDDTPGGERIRIHHRSGTFTEMHPNGDEVHKIYGDGYEIITKNKNVLISGSCNITINGDSILHVKGNRKEIVEKDYNLIVKGKYNLVSKGEASIMSKEDMTIGAGGDVLGGGGSLNIKTGDHLLITGDLEVDGHLEAYSVGAVRVDARAGLSCGIGDPGNPLKGRLPTPPLGIFSATTVTALLSVAAPLGTFGLMDAILMTDTVNTALHNCHFHVGFKGPTGPPIPKMI